MRRLLKLVLISSLIAGAATALVVVVLIVMNSRDPYGGPIEPSAPH